MGISDGERDLTVQNIDTMNREKLNVSKTQ